MAESDPCNDASKPIAPPKKRSLFSKKLLSTAAEPKEAVDFFSRSKEIFAQNLAEEERKRVKRLEKQERRRSSTKSESRELENGKRRRVSEQSEERATPEDGQTESLHSSPERPKSRPEPRGRDASEDATSLSARYANNVKAAKAQDAGKTVENVTFITLSDSDGSDDEASVYENGRPATRSRKLEEREGNGYVVPRRPAPTEDVMQIDDEDDEEFPELVQQARERARLKALQQQNKAKSTETQNSASIGSQTLDDDIFSTDSTAQSEEPVTLLITSKLEGAKPTFVKRLPSQYLREARWAWCDRQQDIPSAGNLRDIIYLTWNQKKVFDLTTCKSLLQSADYKAEGNLHLEAWTPDSWDIYQKRKAAKARKDQYESGGEEEQREAPVKRIKLVLRASGMEDFKLKVKPTTLIGSMVEAFRKGMKVPPEQAIALHFDGESLDPDSKIEDSEIEELDIIEVHIR